MTGEVLNLQCFKGIAQLCAPPSTSSNTAAGQHELSEAAFSSKLNENVTPATTATDASDYLEVSTKVASLQGELEVLRKEIKDLKETDKNVILMKKHVDALESETCR